MEDDQKENAAHPINLRIPRSPSSTVLTESQRAAANFQTPTKLCNSNSDPWTPTANLKMLISAASPEIRNREREILEEPFSGDELEKTMPSRKEKSLGLLCHKFLNRFPDYPNPAMINSICLDEVAGELSVERRRIYDIVNVLESLHMVSRLAKNKYIWHGRKNLQQTFGLLRRVGEENKYAEQILHLKKREQEEADAADDTAIPKSLMKQAEVSFVELPGLEFRAASVNSRKEKSLRVMSQRFVMLFLVSTPQIVSLDVAAKILIGEDQLEDLDKSKFKTKIRRLYDIANVLSSLNLIKKVHVTEERGRKPAFQWTCPETAPDQQESTLQTSIAVDLRSPKENCAKNLFSSRGKQSFTRHQSLIKLAKSIENDRRKINSAPSSPVKSGDSNDCSSVPSKMAQLAAICKQQLDQTKDMKKVKLKVPRAIINGNAKIAMKPQSQQSFSPVLLQALPFVPPHPNSPSPYAVYMQSPHTNVQAHPVMCAGQTLLDVPLGDKGLQADGKISPVDRPAENETMPEKCPRQFLEHENYGPKRLKSSAHDDLSERLVHSGYLIPVQLAPLSNEPIKDQTASITDPKILTSPLAGVFPLKVMFSPCVSQTAPLSASTPVTSYPSPSAGILNFTLQNKDLISPPCGSAQPVTMSPRNGKPADDLQAAKVLNFKHLSPIPYHGQPFTFYALQQDDPKHTANVTKSLSPGSFIVYIRVLFIFSLVLIFILSPRYGHQNILVYVAICSLLGTFSVSSVKGLGMAVNGLLTGLPVVQHPLPWVLIPILIISVVTPVNYLNKSLNVFNTSLVFPIYYVLFTTVVITTSLILFKEWVSMSPLDGVSSVCGFLVIILGVFMLHAFNNLDISLKSLRQQLHRVASVSTERLAKKKTR